MDTITNPREIQVRIPNILRDCLRDCMLKNMVRNMNVDSRSYVFLLHYRVDPVGSGSGVRDTMSKKEVNQELNEYQNQLDFSEKI